MIAGRLTALILVLIYAQHGGAATDWTLYLRHAGPLRIGMTLAQARRALGDPKAYLEGLDDPDSCAYLESKALPESLGVMFLDKRLARFDVFRGDLRTASGAHIGMTEDEIRQMYPGRITTEPHTYTDGHYLEFYGRDAADKNLGMVFETDEGRVTRFRTGTTSGVALVEGCA